MWGLGNMGYGNPGFTPNYGGAGYVHSPNMGYNQWNQGGYNYQQMPGYNYINYSGGWNHDNQLMNNINLVFQRYDRNFSGQLEGQEFFYAYRDLCLMMGVAPPNNPQDVWNAVMAGDANRDGRISRQELFMLFKRIQNINGGARHMGPWY